MSEGNTLYDIDNFQTDRISKDTTVNNFGRHLISMCLSCNIHMLNGRKHGDEHGEYTYITPQGKGMVDYILCFTGIYKHISEFRVCFEDVTEFVDHLPVYCKLSINYEHNRDHIEENAVDAFDGVATSKDIIKRDADKRNNFITLLNDERTFGLCSESYQICNENKLDEAIVVLEQL